MAPRKVVTQNINYLFVFFVFVTITLAKVKEAGVKKCLLVPFTVYLATTCHLRMLHKICYETKNSL